VVEKTNKALLALKMLWVGIFDDRILAESVPRLGSEKSKSGWRLSERVKETMEILVQPEESPKGTAALKQMGLVDHSAGLRTVRTKPGKEELRLPNRGEIIPAVVREIALPPEDHTPVMMTEISPRAKYYLDDYMVKMLKPIQERERLQRGPRAYVDPVLQKKSNALELACRMAKSGMLVATQCKSGGVGLFTVVKSAVRKEGRVETIQRLVFDQRADNEYWRRPPWTGLAGPGAFASLDMSLTWGPNLIFETAAGDLPNCYYTLALPYEMSQWFVLPNVTATELREELVAQGRDDVVQALGEGPFLGLKVLAMGWSWAVFLAQTSLEDLLMEADPKHLTAAQRIIEGGIVPKLKINVGPVHYSYIDDFGIMGVRQKHQPSQVREIFRRVVKTLHDRGFKVHKEVFGEEVKAIGLMIGGNPPSVAPPQDKLWLAVEGCLEISKSLKMLPKIVESCVALCNWLFLINRPMLSIFFEVYPWIVKNREITEFVELPTSLRCEFGVAAALLPLIRQDLTAVWDHYALVGDASERGGAVLESKATIKDLQNEARWAPRGGWMTYTDNPAAEELIARNEEIPEPMDGIPVVFIPREPGVKVFRFLHLFSGHRRQGDLEYFLKVGAAKRGWIVEVINVDVGLGKEFDLSCEKNVDRFKAMIRAGLEDGGHSGVPCSTWTAVRYRPGGPPPLRSRTFPWGLPGLSRKDREKTELHTRLMRTNFELMDELAAVGATVSMEHPADPGRDPFPSIWDTSLCGTFVKRWKATRVTFPQCVFGAMSKKPTMMMTVGMDPSVFREAECPHSVHGQVLVGRDEAGEFKTRQAQAYPPPFCREIAEMHLTAWERRQPLSAGRTSEQLINARARAEYPDLGTRLPVPEVEAHWDNPNRWHEAFRWKWKHEEHINLLEARVALAGAQHASRRAHSVGKRVLIISDSQATIGAMSKGRSRIWKMNTLVRRMASLVMSFRSKFYFRYIRTHRNPADGPSRGLDIGEHEDSVPVMACPTHDSLLLPDFFKLHTDG